MNPGISGEQKAEPPSLDQEYRDIYRQEAPVYDNKRFVTASRAYYAAVSADAYRELADVTASARILDVATGTGRVALALSKTGAFVIGADLTPEMLGVASRRARDSKATRICFHVANARSLPFQDHQFDVVLAVRFLHLFPLEDQRYFLSEMARVVKPDGRIIVELNNALGGVIVRPLLDLIDRFSGRSRGGRLWPFGVAELFRGYHVVARRGIWFPGMGRLAVMSPRAANAIDRLGRWFPFCYLTDQIAFVLTQTSSRR